MPASQSPIKEGQKFSARPNPEKAVFNPLDFQTVQSKTELFASSEQKVIEKDLQTGESFLLAGLLSSCIPMPLDFRFIGAMLFLK